MLTSNLNWSFIKLSIIFKINFIIWSRKLINYKTTKSVQGNPSSSIRILLAGDAKVQVMRKWYQAVLEVTTLTLWMFPLVLTHAGWLIQGESTQKCILSHKLSIIGWLPHSSVTSTISNLKVLQIKRVFFTKLSMSYLSLVNLRSLQ